MSGRATGLWAGQATEPVPAVGLQPADSGPRQPGRAADLGSPAEGGRGDGAG